MVTDVTNETEQDEIVLNTHKRAHCCLQENKLHNS